MTAWVIRSLLALVLLVAEGAPPASALDRPVSAEKLIVARRGSGTEKLVLVSKDAAALFPVVGSADDPGTGTPGGAHRTFLNPDGAKRERKMLGRKGCVMLSPSENVHYGLGICEGIENGLAVLLSGWAPIWAACDAGSIAKFPAVTGVDSLTVFADADTAGERAARECVERWRSAGRAAASAACRRSTTS